MGNLRKWGANLNHVTIKKLDVMCTISVLHENKVLMKT